MREPTAGSLARPVRYPDKAFGVHWLSSSVPSKCATGDGKSSATEEDRRQVSRHTLGQGLAGRHSEQPCNPHPFVHPAKVQRSMSNLLPREIGQTAEAGPKRAQLSLCHLPL